MGAVVAYINVRGVRFLYAWCPRCGIKSMLRFYRPISSWRCFLCIVKHVYWAGLTPEGQRDVNESYTAAWHMLGKAQRPAAQTVSEAQDTARLERWLQSQQSGWWQKLELETA